MVVGTIDQLLTKPPRIQSLEDRERQVLPIPIEIRHLRTFTVLADLLHFGRTAERMHVAQSAVSNHLQQLECSVGAQLIHRDSRNVRLTDAGVTYLRYAQGILDDLDAAREAALLAAEGRAGQIDVGFPSPLGGGFLAALLKVHQQLHPAVTLQMHEYSASELLRPLLDGRVDALVQIPVVDAAGTRSMHLRSTQMLGLVSADDPLGEQDECWWDDLVDRTFVVATLNTQTQIEAFCASRVLAVPRRIVTADGFQSAVAAVCAHNYVSAVPANLPFSHPGIQALPIRGVLAEERLFWRTGEEERGVIRQFLATAQALAEGTVSAVVLGRSD